MQWIYRHSIYRQADRSTRAFCQSLRQYNKNPNGSVFWVGGASLGQGLGDCQDQSYDSFACGIDVFMIDFVEGPTSFDPRILVCIHPRYSHYYTADHIDYTTDYDIIDWDAKIVLSNYRGQHHCLLSDCGWGNLEDIESIVRIVLSKLGKT